jgi:hypothetical protein
MLWTDDLEPEPDLMGVLVGDILRAIFRRS